MKRVLIVGLVLGISSLGYCFLGFPTYSWHQKMTIEVEVNGQVYTGSSVVRVSKRENDPLSRVNGPYYVTGVRGEAAFVELPGKRYLFALLAGGPPDSGPATNAVNLFSKDLPPGDGLDRYVVLSQSKFKRDIPSSHYPLLVTFTDINDPKTVKKVDPNNLASTFGTGVLLKRITLEITNERVTDGKVENLVGWLGDPRIMKNPGWRNLPSLTQTMIYGLRLPVNPVK